VNVGWRQRFLAFGCQNLNRPERGKARCRRPQRIGDRLWFGRRTFVTAPCIPITMKVSGILTFMASSTRFAGLWDEFLSEGQVTLTQAQVRDRSGSSPGSVRVAVAEAQRRHLLFQPGKGSLRPHPAAVPARGHRTGRLVPRRPLPSSRPELLPWLPICCRPSRRCAPSGPGNPDGRRPFGDRQNVRADAAFLY